MTKCKWHCCNNLTNKSFCSSKCKNKFYVDKRRKTLKQKAIEYKNSKCIECGYSKCLSALEFHHINPNIKDFGISQNGYTLSWDKIKQELDKCILLCANCHRELHEKLRVP